MPGNGLWRTKTIEQSIAETDEPDTKLRKNLGTWDLIVFGVSVVVGAGIFTIAASTAGDKSGPSVTLAFVMAAIACGFAALCYAEFASTVPVAGSAYTYSYATFGEFVAWIIGWDLVLEFAVAAAVISKGWSTYLNEAFGLIGMNVPTSFELGGGFQFDWGAVLLVAVLASLLAAGTKLSARVSLVITTLKVAVVVFVIIAGIAYINPDNYTPFIPPATPAHEAGSVYDQSLLSVMLGGETSSYGMYGLLAGASLVFFAFIGFDIVATTAEETRDPQRDTPRGIFGSLGIVTVLYVAVALVVTGMTSYTNLQSKPDGTEATLATAFGLNGVTWAAAVITLGALIGLITVSMVLMLGQIRVLFAMSRDSLLPRAIAKTSSNGVPTRATLLVGGAVLVVAGFFPADKLEEMVNVGTLFAFVLVSAGVVLLRRTRPDLRRGFRAPLVPLVPILAILACLWLMLNLTTLTWLRFAGWMVVGVLIYFFYGMRHSNLARQQRGEVPSGAADSGGGSASE